MKTTYWYSKCETDCDAYSIREKSKTTAKRLIKELSHHRWGPLVKVVVEGPSLFAILKEALGEGSLYAEYRADHEGRQTHGFVKCRVLRGMK